MEARRRDRRRLGPRPADVPRLRRRELGPARAPTSSSTATAARGGGTGTDGRRRGDRAEAGAAALPAGGRRRARAAHEHDDPRRLGAAALAAAARSASSPGSRSATRRARSSSSPSRAGGAASRPTPSSQDFAIGDGREVLSEVIELRLRGEAARHPASDRPAAPDLRPARVLPVARASPTGTGRRSPRSSTSATGSSSTRPSGTGSPAPTTELARLFDRIAVSDLAWRRTLPWRVGARRALAGDPQDRAAARSRARAPTRSCSPAGFARGSAATSRSRRRDAPPVTARPGRRRPRRAAGRSPRSPEAISSPPSSTRSRATRSTRPRSAPPSA